MNDPKFDAVERVLRGAVSKVLHEYASGPSSAPSTSGSSYSGPAASSAYASTSSAHGYRASRHDSSPESEDFRHFGRISKKG